MAARLDGLQRNQARWENPVENTLLKDAIPGFGKNMLQISLKTDVYTSHIQETAVLALLQTFSPMTSIACCHASGNTTVTPHWLCYNFTRVSISS